MKILITGGTGTLGKALIKEFNNSKDEIVFTYHSNNTTALKLEKEFGVKAIHTSKLEDIVYDFDIIINNAAISGEIDQCENISIDSWREVLEVNVTLPFMIIKRNLPYMKRKNYGRIINISTVYAIRAEEDLVAFNSSKCALIGLTKSIAKEYAQYGITCNSILPGTFESNVADKIANIYSSEDNYHDEMINNIPAKRLGKPAEIAKLVKYISSEDASYINGASITIDGGYTA